MYLHSQYLLIFCCNELIEFYKMFGPNESDFKRRLECFNEIKQAIEKSNKKSDFNVAIFGSSCTNLYVNSKVDKFYGFDSSDIDIVVQGSLSLKMIKNALSAYKDRFINLCILRAKVSLVKGTDCETYTDFDICVNQNDGINGTLFINKIIKEFKEIKYIVIFLKVLLSVNNLNKTFDGGISSYGLILLVVSYFQQFKNKSKILDQNSKSNSGVLLSDHLINIFNLYGSEFNYKDVGISLRNGGFYYKRRDKNFDNSMSAKAFLSLENPVEPNVNVAKQAYRFERIKELFKSCIEKIKSCTEELSISVIRLILPTKNDQIKKYLFN